jgi:hypothetical protein
MIRLPGGTFRIGSDRHYPDEAPVHRATIDGFWIDGTPITNRQFQHFVEATGYVTVPEIAPDPKDYSSALPRGPELRSLRAWDSNSTPGAEGRLASVRAQLLSPLPPGSASPAAGRHFDEPCRLPLHHQREEDPMNSDRVSSQAPGGRSRLQRMRAKAALIGATALISAAIAAPAAAQAPQQKPNILFIMGDDIGWMQPGIYHQGLMLGVSPTIRPW